LKENGNNYDFESPSLFDIVQQLKQSLQLSPILNTDSKYMRATKEDNVKEPYVGYGETNIIVDRSENSEYVGYVEDN